MSKHQYLNYIHGLNANQRLQNSSRLPIHDRESCDVSL